MYRVYSDISNGAAWFSQLKKIQELLWHDKIKCNAWKLQHYFEMRLPSCTDDSFNTWNSLSLGWSWLWWKSWCTSTLILAEKKLHTPNLKRQKLLLDLIFFFKKIKFFFFKWKLQAAIFESQQSEKIWKPNPSHLKLCIFNATAIIWLFLILNVLS